MWGAQGGSSDHLCRLHSIFPSRNLLSLSPLRFHSSSSIQADLPTGEEAFQGARTCPPSKLLPQPAGPLLIPYFSFVLPGYVEVFLCF